MENHSNEPLILFCHDNIPAVDSNLIHPHAAIHPGTIKKMTAVVAVAVWTIPEKDISELLGARM